MQCIHAFMWSGVYISVFLLTTAQRSSVTRYSLESVCLSACLSVSVTSLCSTEFSRNFAPSAFSTVAGRSSGRTFPQKYRGRFDRTPSGAAFLRQYCSTSLLLHKVFSVLTWACESLRAFFPHIPNLLNWLIPNETVHDVQIGRITWMLRIDALISCYSAKFRRFGDVFRWILHFICWMSAIFLLPVCLTYWPRKYTTRVDPHVNNSHQAWSPYADPFLSYEW